MVRDLGQTRLVREVERISQSHQKPTTKMISLLNLTSLGTSALGWLSGHEPQLWMMIEAYKCYDGQALGSEKVGECSGEGGEKIGHIQAPPKTYHKNAYVPKPNPLRNKLDTTPDPPIFSHSTNDFAKPIKFNSDLGNVSLGKRVRSLVRRNRLRSRVKRNQVSSPIPSLSLSP
jgi:hypothetical protein